MSRPCPRDTTRVPCAPISRLLREYIKSSNGTVQALSDDLAGRVEFRGGPINFRTSIVYGGSKTIDRDLADRILCAIDCVEAWHLEPELAA